MDLFTLFVIFNPFVVDGDTFYFNWTKFRLYGLNAPERGFPCYQEATEALKDFFKYKVQALVIGKDRFGRALVLMWSKVGSVASYLFSKGLAIPYPYAAPPVALGYLADALKSWKPGCLFREGRVVVKLVTFVYNPPGPDLEKVILESSESATVTIVNKRWQEVTTTVTPGFNTVTLTNFLGNKGDIVLVHVDRTVQALVAYVPKAFTVTVYSGDPWVQQKGRCLR